MIEFAPTASNLTLSGAIIYCQFLTYNGHTDWRLPTFEEYQEYAELHGWHDSCSVNVYTDEYVQSVVPVRTK